MKLILRKNTHGQEKKMDKKKILILPGDGIGSEAVDEVKKIIDIFNKKAIYLYLREITGLNTKQIVNSLKKFRKKYQNFKHDWDSGDL